MQKITEKDIQLFEEVAKFLSGRVRHKSKKETQNRAKIDHLIRRFGYKKFRELLMEKIREIGEAGPGFMYRANLDIKSQMMELNKRLREIYVNPRLYDAVDTMPAINFSSFIGASVPENQLLPFSHFHFPLEDEEEMYSEDSKGKEEMYSEDSKEEMYSSEDSKGKEEMYSFEDSKGKEEMYSYSSSSENSSEKDNTDSDYEYSGQETETEEMEEIEETPYKYVKNENKRRKVEEKYDVDLIEEEYDIDLI